MTAADRAGPVESGLAARLANFLPSLDTPIGDLPVGGYRPPGDDRPRPAAVLVGVLDAETPSVVLTVRSTRLPTHAGQVAFPGGAREAGDASVVDTALREAEEEAGIEAERVRPVGFLGRYDTVTGYRMTAVVGVLDAGVTLRPDRSEVDEVFTVPLDRVADDRCYRCDRVQYRGRRYDILTLAHDEHRIWGATAALLHDFGARLRRER